MYCVFVANRGFRKGEFWFEVEDILSGAAEGYKQRWYSES